MEGKGPQSGSVAQETSCGAEACLALPRPPAADRSADRAEAAAGQPEAPGPGGSLGWDLSGKSRRDQDGAGTCAPMEGHHGGLQRTRLQGGEAGNDVGRRVGWVGTPLNPRTQWATDLQNRGTCLGPGEQGGPARWKQLSAVEAVASVLSSSTSLIPGL